MCWCCFFDKCCRDDEFTYEKLAVDALLVGDMYISYADPNNCIHLILKVDEEVDLPSFGWKLHIGVVWEDIPRAWNAIKDTLIYYRIAHSKFMKKEVAQLEQSGQGCGREMSIYVFQQCDPQLIDWAGFLREIEDRLSNARITPTAVSPACAPMLNCRYVSCRCDMNREGGYLDHNAAIELSRTENVPAWNPYMQTHQIPEFLVNLIDLQGVCVPPIPISV